MFNIVHTMTRRELLRLTTKSLPNARQCVRCLCTRSKYFAKTKKVVNELELIKFEKQFQHQRTLLSPVNASDYRQWLSRVCSERNDTSMSFERKYRKVQTICRLYNKLLEQTFRVPTQLNSRAISELLDLDLEEDITRQIVYLYKLEMMRWTEKQQRKQDVCKTKERLEEKHSGRTSRIGVFVDNQLVYGLWHNTMFTRVRPKVYRNYISRTRLKNAALFGQKIVIDFGFEEYVNLLSAKQMLAYLIKMFNFNKYKLEQPFDLSFHNLDKSGYIYRLFNDYFHDKSPIEQFINLEEDSYLNHYDFDRLCYISPQAEQPLEHYDQNAIYILPAVVHHNMDPPLSMMRIRMEGIKMRRIDVQQYKVLKDFYHLELPNTLQILSHFRDHNDIKAGVELYLPKSVLKSDEDLADDDNEVVRKMFYKKKVESQKRTKIYRPIYD